MTNASAPVPVPPTRKPGAGTRWVVGCLAVVLVVAALGGAAFWWFIGRPLGQIARAAADVTQVVRLDERVRDRSTYAPPVDGLLAADQVERYVAVLGSVQASLEGRLGRLEERFELIDGTRPTWREVSSMAGAYADLLRLAVEAKEAQVEALNAQGFSLSEARWVRQEVLRATGLPGAAVDLGGYMQGLSAGRAPDALAFDPTTAPAPNRALVEGVRAQLDDAAVLLLLGF